MTTTTCFEVRDARGRNVGECYDSTAGQAIDRAVETHAAIEGLGPLSIVQLEQRVIVQTMCEEKVCVVGGTPIQTAALLTKRRELRTDTQPGQRLAA